jgi:hypothetical protein
MTDQDREEIKSLIQETMVEVLKTRHDREDMRSLIRETLAEFLRLVATSPLPSNIVQAVTDDQRARRASLEDWDRKRIKRDLRDQQRAEAASVGRNRTV